MKKRILSKSTFIAVLMGCSVLLTTISYADISSEAQVQSLRTLARFEGINPSDMLLQQPVKGNPMNPFTLKKLEQAALNDGMKLTDQKMSLSDLRKMHAPAIARLSNPDELVTIAAIGQNEAIVYEDATLQIMPIKLLSQRYGGEVLLYEHYLQQKPHIVVDDPVPNIKINTIGSAFPSKRSLCRSLL